MSSTVLFEELAGGVEQILNSLLRRVISPVVPVDHLKKKKKDDYSGEQERPTLSKNYERTRSLTFALKLLCVAVDS
ncbi:unnamed protein product [Heligmosomoides polygyrus]|uniref:Ras-GAP domain-containing protein n=1 Tax=Heligmosomoides polygyrus TaxID=6339 RepID=A0A183G2T4_HELPZ|nr:unnamed protein product [Heligmosomoides polygyrus]